MKLKEWIYIGIIVIAFAFLVISEYNKKEPIDWSITLSNKEKQPFGAYASLELFKDMFNEVTVTRVPIYNQLTETSQNTGSYVFIEQNYSISKLDLDYLLDFVYEGNNVFIAAEYISQNLLDSLKVEAKQLSFVEVSDSSKVGVDMVGKNKLFLTNDKSKLYDMPKNRSLLYFSKFDVLDTKTLGMVEGQDLIDFIRVEYGDGYFYLNANPVAFSNYYVLNKQTNEYAFTALSYLPKNELLIWDEYDKQGRIGETSSLRGILSYPALRWALYLALIGIIIFVIFEGKRRQRIIPIIKPLPNQTLDFVKVIGNLYFNKRNNTDIAIKRSTYLLEFIRNRYYEQTNVLDDEFIQRIIEKTGCEPTLVKQLMVAIIKLKEQDNRDWMSDGDLSKLNNLIEGFYATAG